MPKPFAPGKRYKKNYDERDIEQAVEAIKGVFRENKLPKKNRPWTSTYISTRRRRAFSSLDKGMPAEGVPQTSRRQPNVYNIKENKNKDFMKLYQIQKNFEEGGEQKRKNKDREPTSEEMLNIETMELFIDDVHIEYIDECTETNLNASSENESLNLSNICENNIILEQTTKTVDINYQIPSYAGNEVTLEKNKQNEVVLPKMIFKEKEITVNRGLTDLILYPKTPKQKGKRNTTEQLPFVLTTSGWKQIRRDKEARKRIE
ncbi:hypothetical protein ILUMI_00175 [Ignelater luminosus]|uniref:Uncharacterized protein n=1 Tax=Ignelater luminosus TaxID=2038154 RepID=A0A8K0GNC8_IGNLU|nr:hypothetical protein ILUMI_00175 [Ignelater luminosus]